MTNREEKSKQNKTKIIGKNSYEGMKAGLNHKGYHALHQNLNIIK
jgi:hypothetical protein